MNTRKGLSVQPKVPDKLKSADTPKAVIYQNGNPDLEVGAVHKVRIRKDNTPPSRIYNSEVVEVHGNYYLEKVETVPKTKTTDARYRLICFPKVDHRFGIDSCDLTGKYDEKEDKVITQKMQAEALCYALKGDALDN